MGNMYSDSVGKVANLFVGCKFDCLYCRKSFKAQMKRQKNNCGKCYTYEPHFHEERLNQKLPLTSGDEFIWLVRSGDPSFMSANEFQKMLDLIKLKKNKYRTFLIQTKNPYFLQDFEYSDNILLGITLESDFDHTVNGYFGSKAPKVWIRKMDFENIDHPRKIITIEPIMDFTLEILTLWISQINPERIYIGYDTKKSYLPEPPLQKTMELIEKLEIDMGFKVKIKLLREAWYEK